MSHGITCKNLDSAGGVQLADGQDFVRVDGEPVVLLGDRATPHPILPPHSTAPFMEEGSSFFRINGTPVAGKAMQPTAGRRPRGPAGSRSRSSG